MAYGTPVIAARCAAVAEVAGDAIAYFEPGDVEGLAALMRSPPDGAPGRVRARAFSWDDSALAHVEAYTLACRQ
jgi:glycosyltransferase involved in cell wall biosynthesis